MLNDKYLAKITARADEGAKRNEQLALDIKMLLVERAGFVKALEKIFMLAVDGNAVRCQIEAVKALREVAALTHGKQEDGK